MGYAIINAIILFITTSTILICMTFALKRIKNDVNDLLDDIDKIVFLISSL